MKLYKLKNIKTGEIRYYSKKTNAAMSIGTNGSWFDYKLNTKGMIGDWELTSGDFEDVLNKYIIS